MGWARGGDGVGKEGGDGVGKEGQGDVGCVTINEISSP